MLGRQAGHGALVLAVLCGGVRAQCYWTHTPAAGPQNASGGAAAYDAALGKVVYVDYDALGTNLRTWTWDGTAWTMAAGVGPSQRYWYEVAYDSVRNRLVLFGGFFIVNGPYATDTWAWDGAAWAQVATSGPSARTNHAMVFDSLRSRVVLFGGLSPAGQELGDTWEWDGTAWTQRAVVGPPVRQHHAMGFDAGRGRTVLFGGERQSVQLADLWEWDGAVWLQRTNFGPTARADAWLLYDPARARMMLLEGRGPSVLDGEAWDFDGATGDWAFTTASGPTRAPAAYDVARGRAVAPVNDFGLTTATWEYNPGGTLSGAAVIQSPLGGSFTSGATVALSVAAIGTGPLSYQWRHNGQALANSGRISGADTTTLTITGAQASDSGTYEALVSNACDSVLSAGASVQVGPAPCYVNCDGSTTLPVLNILDFGCFLNRFAAGDSYANCDHSTTPPVLNILDFGCFLNAFAAGCP